MDKSMAIKMLIDGSRENKTAMIKAEKESNKTLKKIAADFRESEAELLDYIIQEAVAANETFSQTIKNMCLYHKLVRGKASKENEI